MKPISKAMIEQNEESYYNKSVFIDVGDDNQGIVCVRVCEGNNNEICYKIAFIIVSRKIQIEILYIDENECEINQYKLIHDENNKCTSMELSEWQISVTGSICQCYFQDGDFIIDDIVIIDR